MYPVLFKLWGIPVHSYYVLWAVALSIGVAWTRKRAVKVYGLEDEIARMTLILSFIGMLVGARIGGYFDHWSYYMANPADIINPMKGALSSTTAFVGGGLFAIFYLYRKRAGIFRMAEAASLPAAMTVSVGRIGCFLNGCCLGLPSEVPWAVSFPSDKGLFLRHPVQLYYTIWYIIIMFVLFFLERNLNRTLRSDRTQSFLWPVFMILYGGSRFLIDFIRVGDRIIGLRTAQIVGILVMIAGFVWLSTSIKRYKDLSNKPA